MRVTVEDVRFWEAKQAHPKWWFQYKERMRVSNPSIEYNIDRVVNGHAHIVEKNYPAHNTLALIRVAMKREPIRTTLERLSVSDDKRRAGYAKKWLARISPGDLNG